jgi:hypothetical protein
LRYYFRAPPIINTAPTAQSIPPITGDTFSLLLVVTPTDASPTEMPWVCRCGTATTNDAIPSINTTSPTQNSGFISFSGAQGVLQ